MKVVHSDIVKRHKHDISPGDDSPADVALTEVLVVGRLLHQKVHLLLNAQGLLVGKVSASQLLPHPRDDRKRLLVQSLGLSAV